MLKKTITFEDPITEKDVSEEYYFHLSKADLLELDIEENGGLEKLLQDIVDEQDVKKIYQMFKRIVLIAVGKQEGRRFIKNEEIRQDFSNSPAYGELVLEIIQDADAAGIFMNGIMPAGLRDAPAAAPAKKLTAAQRKAQQKAEAAAIAKDEAASESKKLTIEEARDMDEDELRSGLATGRYTLTV